MFLQGWIQQNELRYQIHIDIGLEGVNAYYLLIIMISFIIPIIVMSESKPGSSLYPCFHITYVSSEVCLNATRCVPFAKL